MTDSTKNKPKKCTVHPQDGCVCQECQAALQYPSDNQREEIIEILEEHATGMNQNLWSSLVESMESFAIRVHSDAYVAGFNAGADDAESLIKQEVDKAVVVDENTSDGYHTFKELYQFRMVYNAALFNEWASQKKYKVHKSWKHSDSELCFGGGWFIVMAELPTGQQPNNTCKRCGWNFIKGLDHSDCNGTGKQPDDEKALRQAWDELEADIRADERNKLTKVVNTPDGYEVVEAHPTPSLRERAKTDQPSNQADAPDATSAKNDQKDTRPDSHVPKGTSSSTDRERIDEIVRSLMMYAWTQGKKQIQMPYSYNLHEEPRAKESIDAIQSLITRAQAESERNLGDYKAAAWSAKDWLDRIDGSDVVATRNAVEMARHSLDRLSELNQENNES